MLAVSYAFFVRPFMKEPKLAGTVGIAYFLTDFFLNIIWFDIGGHTASLISCTVMCTVMCMLDKTNREQKIVLSIFCFSFRWIVSGVMILPRNLMFDCIILKMSDRSWQQFWFYVFTEIVYLLLKGIGLYVLIKITSSIYAEKKEPMSKQEFMYIVFCNLPSLTGNYFISYFTTKYEIDTGGIYFWNVHEEYHWMCALYDIFACGAIWMSVVMVQTIKRQKREEKENAVLAGQVTDMENHIREVEKMYHDIRGLRHDMGNHIMTLESLYKKQEWEEAQLYSEKVRKALAVSSLSVKSGNPVTDIILEEMRRKAEEKGICFESSFTFGTDSNIDTFDISVILNNALTNAIEGASGNAPCIHILSCQRKNAFMIMVKNSFTGNLILPEGSGMPQTSKKDRQRHGYGLTNIQKVAKKYQGDIMIQAEKGEFILTVMLMLV